MSEPTPAKLFVTKKRSYDEAEGLLPSTDPNTRLEETHLPTPTSPPLLQNSPEPGRLSSPAVSVESSVLSDAKSMTPSAISPAPATASLPALVKKRKMNNEDKQVERALKQSEKEERERVKAEELRKKKEEKAAREEEKRRKEKEKENAKRQRELDRAEKQKAKEAERQAKESTRKKEDEEKKKKERAQLRLGSFFRKPSVGEPSEEPSRPSSRRSSIVSLGTIDLPDKEQSAKVSPQKKTESTSGFLSFFVAQNVKMAPLNLVRQDATIADMKIRRCDGWMEQKCTLNRQDLISSFPSNKRKRCQKPWRTVKEIVGSVQGSLTSPIDLTAENVALTEFSDVPYKILSFKEDVRPPYKGTYTRAVSPNSALKLSRRPFTRRLPDTNYDYDSEAEWEPPNEDDEDLESGDDESDAGEEGEEDMEGFLDDEHDPGRRKQITGAELAPVSSGLCWADPIADQNGKLEDYRIQPLSDEYVFPLDPFSTSYWPKPHHLSTQLAMHPPPTRLPLSSLNPNLSPSTSTPSDKGDENQQRQQKGSSVPCQNLTTGTATSAGKPLKIAPDDVLPALKQAIVGSVHTKIGLVDILKKQFPALSKETVRDTLGHVAVRQGKNEADKRWVLKD